MATKFQIRVAALAAALAPAALPSAADAGAGTLPDKAVGYGGCSGSLRLTYDSFNTSPYLSATCSIWSSATPPSYLAYMKGRRSDGSVTHYVGALKTMRKTADGLSWVTDGYRQFGTFSLVEGYWDACARITTHSGVLLDQCHAGTTTNSLWSGVDLHWSESDSNK